VIARRIVSKACEHLSGKKNFDKKFMGSRLEIKVEKIENPTIFWQPSRTYCLNMTKSEFFPLGIWWFTKILFPCMSQDYSFELPSGKDSAQTKC
jgi:hypothetical protein